VEHNANELPLNLEKTASKVKEYIEKTLSFKLNSGSTNIELSKWLWWVFQFLSAYCGYENKKSEITEQNNIESTTTERSPRIRCTPRKLRFKPPPIRKSGNLTIKYTYIIFIFYTYSMGAVCFVRPE